MRTTVTLDSDAEQVVRERMRARGVSFKQALNDSIRDGAHGRVDYVFVQETVDLGEPTADLTKALQIADEMEDERLVAKLRQGR
jgi:hypothetical protein